MSSAGRRIARLPRGSSLEASEEHRPTDVPDRVLGQVGRALHRLRRAQVALGERRWVDAYWDVMAARGTLRVAGDAASPILAAEWAQAVRLAGVTGQHAAAALTGPDAALAAARSQTTVAAAVAETQTIRDLLDLARVETMAEAWADGPLAAEPVPDPGLAEDLYRQAARRGPVTETADTAAIITIAEHAAVVGGARRGGMSAATRVPRVAASQLRERARVMGADGMSRARAAQVWDDARVRYGIGPRQQA